MYEQYGRDAQFLAIYIKEAHPSDDWVNPVNLKLKAVQDPRTTLQRLQVATTCMSDLGVRIPCLVDDMENSTARAYKAWPDRLFVVDREGRIAYTSDPGPRGYLPHAMEAALVEALGSDSQ